MAHFYTLFQRNEKVNNEPLRLADLTDYEVHQMTRFPRSAVRELCDMVKDDIERPTSRSKAIPVDTQVLAAMQFYASGSFQWVVGRSCGLSQSSVSLAVDDVTKALVQ